MTITAPPPHSPDQPPQPAVSDDDDLAQPRAWNSPVPLFNDAPTTDTPVWVSDQQRIAQALDNPDGAPEELSEAARKRLDELTGHYGLMGVALNQNRDVADKVLEEVNRQRTIDANTNLPKNRFLRMFKRMKLDFMKTKNDIRTMERARDEIVGEQNIHLYNGDTEQAAIANNVTLKRFAADAVPDEDILNEQAGEARTHHTEKSDYFLGHMRKLATEYLGSDFSDDEAQKAAQDAFTAGKEELLKVLYKQAEAKDGYLVTTDNLSSVVENVRQSIDELVDATLIVRGTAEHLAAIQYAVNKMTFMSGETHESVYRGPDYSRMDKIVEKLSKSRVGRLVTPETIAVAAAASAVAARVFVSKTAAVATGGIGGVGAGVLAFARENKTLKDERAEHESGTTIGMTFAPEDKRHAKMEEFAYDKVPIKDTIQNLGAMRQTLEPLLAKADNREVYTPEELENLKQQFEQAVDAIAEATARKRISNDKSIANLFTYDNEQPVGKYQLDLGIALAGLKVELKECLRNCSDDVRQELLGDGDFKELCEWRTLQQQEELGENIKEQDKAFARYRRRRAAIMGTVTGVGGALLAEGAHLGYGAIANTDTAQQVAEVVKTTIDGKMLPFHYTPGGPATMQIDGGYSISNNHDGSIRILDSSGKTVPELDNLHVDAQGHLPDNAVQTLNSHGFHVDTQSVPVAGKPPVSMDQYIAEHRGDYQQLQVEYQSSGMDQSGYLTRSPDGKIIPSGSESFDISYKLQDGTEVHKVLVAGQPLPPPLDKLFTENPDHTWNYLGKGEVHWGKMVDGHFEAQASLGGLGQNVVVTDGTLASIEKLDTITADVAQQTQDTVSSASSIDTAAVAAAPLGVPLVLAQHSRKGLEMSVQQATEVRIKESGALLQDIMPALKEHPDAPVALDAALAYHHQRLGEQYTNVLQELGQILDTNKSMEKLAIDTDGIVPWTVDATGDSEELYRVLKQYGERGLNESNKSRLVLNLTYTEEESAKQPEAVTKTHAAIDRIRREYPDLRLSSFETVVKQADMDDGDYDGRSLIEIGDDRAFELIMEAAYRAVQSGQRPADQDILVFRREPGSLIVSTQEANMLKAMEEHRDKDMFVGGVEEVGADSPSAQFMADFRISLQQFNQRTETPAFNQLSVHNRAYRLSKIAAVGGGYISGVQPDLAASNRYDLVLGERLSRVRQTGTANGAALFVANATIGVDGDQSDETVDEEPQEAIARVEQGINDILQQVNPSDLSVRSVLAREFPVKRWGRDKRFRTLYQIKTTNGKREFSLTNQGREWLLQQFRNNLKYKSAA